MESSAADTTDAEDHPKLLAHFMGQKVNPIGYRLALTKDWRSRWYANPKEYAGVPAQGPGHPQAYVKKKLQSAAVAKIVIERAWNSLRVTIFTARPGIVIGRKGAPRSRR